MCCVIESMTTITQNVTNQVMNSPLARLVHSLQIYPSHYFDCLKSLGLFDETNLYLIVVGYIASQCMLTPLPEAISTELELQGKIPQDQIIDRVGSPEFSVGLKGVRFCFPSLPTFKSLGGSIDIGVTIKSCPYNDKVITMHESEYTTLGPTYDRGRAVLGSSSFAQICNRLVYIDLSFNWVNREITVIVAHAASETITDLEFMTYTTIQNGFRDMQLYPLISFHGFSTPVSLHALN